MLQSCYNVTIRYSATLLWLLTPHVFPGQQHFLQHRHLGELVHLMEHVANGGLVIPPGPAWGMGNSSLTCANARAQSAPACTCPSASLCTMYGMLSCLLARCGRVGSHGHPGILHDPLALSSRAPGPKTADCASLGEVALGDIGKEEDILLLVECEHKRVWTFVENIRLVYIARKLAWNLRRFQRLCKKPL